MEIVKSILLLLAGCGVFMMGMKLMSESLERSAGKGMRKLFNKISNNRFAGVGVGAGVTAIIQSSSATTVMVIGFVNAGIMTLFQATAIIMGANIGTTITGLLVSFSSLSIGLFISALSIVGVMIMMFSKNDTVKKVAGILAGLGLIFSGMSSMSGAFQNESIQNAFHGMFEVVDFPLLLILIGVAFTALIQSSSASTGLIITMVSGGLMPSNLGLFVILGTNIGTCITAILASVGASTNAKRAALIHLTFNVIGTAIFTALLWIFNSAFITVLEFLAPGSPAFQISIFHILFNVITTLMLLPFIKQLTKFATILIREKKDDTDILRLKYIDERILHTPPIAVAQVLKEVISMAELARENLNRSFSAIMNNDLSEREKIRKDEERINFINKHVANYLIKMASLNLPKSDERLVGTLHHVISDIERIGDHAENFLEEAEEMSENGMSFSLEAAAELKDMFDKVVLMFNKSLWVFENREAKSLPIISEMEAEIDMLKTLLGHNHIIRLNSGNCTVESGTHFYAITSALERIADHLTNIAFSIKNPSGSQIEAMQVLKAKQKQRTKKDKEIKEKTA